MGSVILVGIALVPIPRMRCVCSAACVDGVKNRDRTATNRRYSRGYYHENRCDSDEIQLRATSVPGNNSETYRLSS